MLDEYKVELKKMHHEVARECHPDLNLEASKEELEQQGARFNRITQAVNYLMKIEPLPPRQPAPATFSQAMRGEFRGRPFVIIMQTSQHPLHFSGSSANATTTGTGGWPWSS